MEGRYVVTRTAVILSVVTLVGLLYFSWPLCGPFLFQLGSRSSFWSKPIPVILCLFALWWALPVYFSVYNYRRTRDKRYFLFLLVAGTRMLYFIFPVGLLIYAAIERGKADGVKRFW